MLILKEQIEGNIYEQHISRSLDEIKELQREHQTVGRVTWLSPWVESVENFWCLTVKI